MSHTTYPLLSKTEAATHKPAGDAVFLFRDKNNHGLLTAMDSDCAFTVIEIHHTDEAADRECVCNLTEEIIEGAKCALEKGMLTPLEYDSIISNLSLSLEHNVDPISGSHQITISNEPAIFVSYEKTDVLCNGDSTGTFTPTITGGTAPLGAPVYSGGADPANLAAGSYTMTVTDANGKVKVVGFIINEPAALSAVTSSTPDTGGSVGTASVVVSGGTPGYTYLWDDPGAQTTPTATGLTAGAYQCTITDANGCVLVEAGIVVA